MWREVILESFANSAFLLFIELVIVLIWIFNSFSTLINAFWLVIVVFLERLSDALFRFYNAIDKFSVLIFAFPLLSVHWLVRLIKDSTVES